jgi:hypothetical protein
MCCKPLTWDESTLVSVSLTLTLTLTHPLSLSLWSIIQRVSNYFELRFKFNKFIELHVRKQWMNIVCSFACLLVCVKIEIPHSCFHFVLFAKTTPLCIVLTNNQQTTNNNTLTHTRLSFISKDWHSLTHSHSQCRWGTWIVWV